MKISHKNLTICACFFVALWTTIWLSACSPKDETILYQLQRLDESIKQRDNYIFQKEKRISLLQERIATGHLPLEEKYGLLQLLFDEYSSYKNDSMFSCAAMLISIADTLQSKDKLVNSYIDMAESYLWAGLFKEAQECANGIDTLQTSLS
ncbi:MAG: hypothetical protein Q4D56_11715 [Bacteroides sp.]|nr:hypothetical protein [Bacteroides sp.]